MRVPLLIFIFLNLLSSQKYDSLFIEAGNRGYYYKVWVYFDKKVDEKYISLSSKNLNRRVKNNSNFKNNWYDQKISEKYKKELRRLGFQIENESRWLNAVTVKCSKSDLSKISNLFFVKKIEPVILRKKQRLKYEQIASYNSQRNINYGGSEAQMNQINCIAAHELGFYGQGVRVLYIDTGYDLTHEAFDSLNLIYQYDFINDDLNTTNETDEEIENSQDNHGTLCLSVLGGFKEGSLIGPAYKSEFLLAKTEIVAEEIQAEEDNFVAALEWGEQNGADIAVSSLGYSDWYEYEDMDGNTAVTTIAVDIAASLGVLCVNSAGNSGNSQWNYITAPADADSVISVGAVDLDGNLASFSSKGPTYDGRLKPEVCALGINTYCVRSNTLSDYRTASGTSLSSPLVGGAAAVILSANFNLTAMQIREVLMNTGSNSANPDTSMGYGVINVVDAINYSYEMKLDEKITTVEDFTISKIYPNPFNPQLNIQLTNVKGKNVKIVVHDINGRLIENLYKGKALSFDLNIKWSPKDIPSGLYLISACSGNHKKVQKVMYLK